MWFMNLDEGKTLPILLVRQMFVDLKLRVDSNSGGQDDQIFAVCHHLSVLFTYRR